MNGDERARGDFEGWEGFEDEARRLYEEGRFREALDVLRAGLAQHPGSAELQVSLGYTHLALESYGWARRAFRRALALEPDHEEALVGLGDTLLKLGERPGAFLCFERILELGHGGDPDLMLAVARALYREELYERALRFYGMAETSADAEAELGYTLHQLGQVEEAARHVAAALDLDPQHHEARVFYANLLYDRGDGEEALSHYARVPPARMWDPLAVWRTVELLRSYRGLDAEEEALEPYLEQLDLLGGDPGPEERLLAEVEAAAAGAPDPSRGAGQLDLFTLGSPVPEGRDPEVHTVRGGDGRVYTGDWLAIVAAMRDQSAHPDATVEEFMRRTARRVRSLTGVDVPADDPEAFLRATARAGLLHIER